MNGSIRCRQRYPPKTYNKSRIYLVVSVTQHDICDIILLPKWLLIATEWTKASAFMVLTISSQNIAVYIRTISYMPPILKNALKYAIKRVVCLLQCVSGLWTQASLKISTVNRVADYSTKRRVESWHWGLTVYIRQQIRLCILFEYDIHRLLYSWDIYKDVVFFFT